MRKLMMMSAALILSGCLEPQNAPELTERSSTEFNAETLAEGMTRPWAVAEIPQEAGGGFLVTEIAGGILRVVDGTSTALAWSGGPAFAPEDLFVSGQGGMLDIAPAPDFPETHEVYLSYAYGNSDANGTALVRARLDATTLANPTVIFRASPPKQAASHFGGRIAFLPDDTLVLSLGDGFAYREDAQKADTHLGKLIRLTRDGGVPEDNPFKGQEKDGVAFKPQIYSMGHRNVQGLAIDPETGVLWEHEHGPRGGDELNRIEAGANYGWPLATKGLDYQGAKITPFQTFEGMIDGTHGWTPSIAPSGLAIYRGDLFPDWNGDALVGGLASRDLRRVDLENGKSVGEEDLLSDLGGRVRDVRVASDGAVLVLIEASDLDGDGEDDPDSGQLLRLSPK
ncbi:PQQ-dependent sugar dehydrogenase [Litorimonas sp. WD9-15]|uniref:PQQ-dependent sugar dehydrogenase n=1 Tax=Litorimonas sp. WD9-15 TaxID=3418716 RepID=UPI003CFDE3E9